MKMKTRVMGAGILMLALWSCKKDYTCECTTTSTTTTVANGVATTTASDPQTRTTLYKASKKSDLRTICGDSKSSYTETGTNANTSSTYDTKCEIK